MQPLKINNLTGVSGDYEGGVENERPDEVQAQHQRHDRPGLHGVVHGRVDVFQRQQDSMALPHTPTVLNRSWNTIEVKYEQYNRE